MCRAALHGGVGLIGNPELNVVSVMMAGCENGRSRPRVPPLQVVCGIGHALCGILALASGLACSDLDRGEDTYCETTGNGIGPVCGASQEDVSEDRWACLDQEPPMLPNPRPGAFVGFIQPVVEWSTLTPLAGRGLQASLCRIFDLECRMPILPPYMIQDGMVGEMPLPPAAAGFAGVVMPEGFSGFIKFEVVPAQPDTPEAGRYVPSQYYLAGSVSGNLSVGPPVIMFQQGVRAQIVQSSFPGTDPLSVLNNAAIAFGVYDCNGKPVSDARIELNVGGVSPPNVIPFQLPASRIPVAQPRDQPLYTGGSGIAGFLNVPPGTVQVRAFRRNDDQQFGAVELGAVAGQLTIGPVRPDYLKGANLEGYTPLVPTTP
jgi:hypothetical protein